jgi:hypothetical protein
MTHVLGVTALEVSYPVVFIILVEGDDLSWDSGLLCGHSGRK